MSSITNSPHTSFVPPFLPLRTGCRRTGRSHIIAASASSYRKPQTGPQLTQPLTRRQFLTIPLALALASIPAKEASSAPQYDKLAPNYELLDGTTTLTRTLGFDALREALVSTARGSVLELAVGTGVNLPLYPDTDRITSLLALDESGAMLRLAQARAATLDNMPPDLRFQRANAARTGLPDASFDTIVITFGLCVFADVPAAIAEMRRLLSPDGIALVLDYSKSAFPPLATYQDVVAPVVARLSKGCTPNLDLPALVANAGFAIDSRTSVLAGTVLALQLRPV